VACTVQSACPDTILTARRYKDAAGPDEQVEVRPARNAAFGFERLIKGAPPGDGVSALHTPDFPFGKGGARGVWRGAGVGVSSCTDCEIEPRAVWVVIAVIAVVASHHRGVANDPRPQVLGDRQGELRSSSRPMVACLVRT